MWHLVSGGSSNDHPLLHTTNGHVGRQYWEFDPSRGTPEERAEVESMRARFTANRHKKRHSDDCFVRLAARQRIMEASIDIPENPIPQGTLPADRLKEHLVAAVKFYGCLQEPDGHWPGDYGGPMFLLPGLVIAAYVTKTLDVVFSNEAKKEIIRYLRNHQNEDGGFGLHIEGHSSMFGTSLKSHLPTGVSLAEGLSVFSYVTMRIMGVSADEKEAEMARAWVGPVV